MRHSRQIQLFSVIAAGLFGAGIAAAAPPNVQPGSAVIDGSTVEWNLAQDFFTNMYRAGKADKPLESKLYLRHDCGKHIVYALVLTEPNVPGLIVSGSTTAWIAIDSQNNKVVNEVSGNDGTAPDFAWVGRGYDGDQSHVRGYEASFVLGLGTYNIIAHIDVLDASAAQTSASPGFPGTGPQLVLGCLVGTESSTWSGMKSLYR